MNAQLKIAISISLMLFCQGASAALYNYDSGNLNATITDNNANGYQNSLIVTDPIGTVSKVTVTLNISGGFNGDLYGYLVHLDANGQNSGFAVLLNRVGVTALNPDGSSDAGFIITLSDSASTDIHNVSNDGAPVTGTYLPDARTADFSSFNGGNAQGTWTLFFADVSAGDESTLVSWNLQLTTPVPEPVTTALIIFGGLAAVRAVARFVLRQRDIGEHANNN